MVWTSGLGADISSCSKATDHTHDIHGATKLLYTWSLLAIHQYCYLGSSMDIPMGIWELTHTHTHCGYVPTIMGVGVPVCICLSLVDIPTGVMVGVGISAGVHKVFWCMSNQCITMEVVTISLATIVIPLTGGTGGHHVTRWPVIHHHAASGRCRWLLLSCCTWHGTHQLQIGMVTRMVVITINDTG